MASLESKFVGTLAGQVALVTGASRGIGKGIARMLGQAGATVYITGRTLEDTSGKPGSLMSTAEQIRSEGGKCIPVQCDHGNDNDVKNLFERIKNEQDGRLDILVNNAFAGVQFLKDHSSDKYYELPIEAWDLLTNVGLRSNFVCAHYATHLMLQRKNGLIVNISSGGGLFKLFNVAYTVGKEGTDRMAVDMAIDVKKDNITVVSMWPGSVITEEISEIMDKIRQLGSKNPFQYPQDATFTGKAVVALAVDKNRIKKTGRILIVAELGQEYGFKDIDGEVPLSYRQIKDQVRRYAPSYAWLVPSFLYMPKWMFFLLAQRF